MVVEGWEDVGGNIPPLIRTFWVINITLYRVINKSHTDVKSGIARIQLRVVSLQIGKAYSESSWWGSTLRGHTQLSSFSQEYILYMLLNFLKI